MDLYQIPKDAHAKRLIAKIMMGMRMIPGIPHPIELLHGSKGGLKSSWCEAQKRMIDPATAMTLRIPDNEDDFALQGYHNYMLVYDNVKRKNIPKWFPDALCRWVYQEASEKRQHYSNMKTVAFGSSGCAIVNGINKMFEEEDVMDRSIASEWRRLKLGQFKTKAKVEEEFLKIQPKLLACLCNKAGKALQIYKEVEQEIESHLLRMADFMVWGECFARAFGYKPMEFKAYKSNLELQNVEIIQNSTIGKIIVNFTHREYNLIIADRRAVGKAARVEYNKAIGPRAIIVFQGSIDILYKRLIEVAQAPPFNIVDIQKAKDFPKGTNKLSQWVHLILSNLSEAFGIDIEMVADTTGTLTGHRNRVWMQITKNPDVAPSDLFGSEDKDDNSDGSMRTRGKCKRDPHSASGRGGSGSGGGGNRSRKKVLSNESLQPLQSLPNRAKLAQESTLKDSKNPGNHSPFSTENSSKIASFEQKEQYLGCKDGKDCKDSLAKTYTLQEVASLLTFDNKQKLHQVCRSLVIVDWEYTDNSTTESNVYLFAYVDTNGKQGVLHVDDFPTPRDYAIAVNHLIESYDYSVAYWSRGRDSDRVTDLMQWHNYCIRVGAPSIVVPVSDYDHYPTIRSPNNPKHRHIDAYLIHNQTFIRTGVYKGAIRSMKYILQ